LEILAEVRICCSLGAVELLLTTPLQLFKSIDSLVSTKGTADILKIYVLAILAYTARALGIPQL
jgi:hypothetical protein